MGEAIAKSGVEHPYNASKHGSELDYLTELIRKARLAPVLDSLKAILDDWYNGREQISAPLRVVEELIEDDILEPDALIVGGFDNYHCARPRPRRCPRDSRNATPLDLISLCDRR